MKVFKKGHELKVGDYILDIGGVMVICSVDFDHMGSIAVETARIKFSAMYSEFSAGVMRIPLILQDDAEFEIYTPTPAEANLGMWLTA